MKKKLLFLLIPCMMLAVTSCVMYNGQGKPGGSKSKTPQSSDVTPTTSEEGGNSQTSQSGDNSQSQVPAGQEVKVYLAFGQYGKYQGSFVTTHFENLFLEHAIEFAGKAGDNLPGKDVVTSSVEGSEFKAWVAYNNDGKLTEYTTIPGENGKILYASFSGGNGNPAGGNVTPTPPEEYAPSSSGELPSEGFGFKFSDNTYMAAFRADDNDGFQQYSMNKKAFKKGQKFQLYDFTNKAGWTVNVDPYSFGGDSATSEAWKAYISNANNEYTVLKDFNVESVYIKLKYQSDQLYFQLAA